MRAACRFVAGGGEGATRAKGQTLSPEQHLEIARHFGEVEEHTFFTNLGAGQEQVTVLDHLVIRHRWQPGDFVLWDDRCVWHSAIGDTQEKRVMHRVSVLGDRAPEFVV